MTKDEYFMTEALKEAQKAYGRDEVPVGAVVVHKDRVIGRAHNQIKLLKDPTAHAEMISLTQAAAHLGNERLAGTTMYVTVEPCAMCAGALVLARVSRLVYGAADPKTGACGSVLTVVDNKKLNHRIKVTKGILQTECALLLKEFFKKKREKVMK
jgi:tRNA(adenine34) deaminase